MPLPHFLTFQTLSQKIHQTKLIDANAGTIEYIYNAFGELESQSDTKGTVSMLYDDLGRITSQTGPEGPTTYSYFKPETGNNRVMGIVTPEGNDISYDYDGLGRNTAIHETIDGTIYTTSYSYDKFSNPIKTIYPSGFSIERSYNAKSYLTQINNPATGKMLWKADAMNGLGQYTQFTQGNQIQTVKTINEFGMTENIKAGSVQDMYFKWNTITGNLEEREDKLKILKENFYLYDDLNRLTHSNVDNKDEIIVNYEDNGNIKSKTGLGNYKYSATRPNAVECVSSADVTNISSNPQVLTYTTFNKIKTVTENNYELTLKYGIGNQRKQSELKQNGVFAKSIIYAGNYEKITVGAEVYEVHYIASGDGLTAINIRNKNIDKMYFVYTDHLGSLLAITDESGTVVYKQNFDAWGRPRNPDDWTYTPNPYAKPEWLIRGFTSHEHLGEFALINMNGRVYDPVVARFLSPDNYVQAPDFTQSYNRYSYALNNPLVYTDPDGEFIFLAIGIGALIGAYIGGSAAEGWEANPTKWAWNADTWKGVGGGALIGAAAGVGFYYAAPALANTAFFSHFTASGTVAAYTLTGMAAGGLTGYGAGFTGGMIYSNGDLGYSNQSGIAGAKLGATLGGMAGYIGGNIKSNERPKSLPSIETPGKPLWKGKYFQGTEEQADNLLADYSKTFNVETKYWATDRGYYYEPIMGNALGTYDSRINNTSTGFKANTFSKSYRYTPIEEENGSLYLNPNIFLISRITSYSHTHPMNSPPNSQDIFDSMYLGIPGAIIGWKFGVKYRY